MSRQPSSAAVEELLSPVVADAGLELDGVTLTQAGRRRLLRVTVDAQGGVSLDAVAEVSQAISAALDGSDVMGATPYVLEVSSPGVDRPLSQPRHWRGATGRLVRVGLTDGHTVTGRVTAVDADGVTMEIGPDVQTHGSGAPRRMLWAELGEGHVQVEFRAAGER